MVIFTIRPWRFIVFYRGGPALTAEHLDWGGPSLVGKETVPSTVPFSGPEHVGITPLFPIVDILAS
jgi:hypothetical protein